MKKPGKTPHTTRRGQAVALEYAPVASSAPRITAKGRGLVAEKIIELAKRHGIPIKEDPDLVQILARLELNQEIPPAVYRVVAEILAFVYSLNQDFGAKKDPGGKTA